MKQENTDFLYRHHTCGDFREEVQAVGGGGWLGLRVQHRCGGLPLRLSVWDAKKNPVV